MFLQNARQGNNQLWTYVVTIVLVFAGALVGQIPLLLVVIQQKMSGEISDEKMLEFSETMNFSLLGINENYALLLMLLAFAGALGGLWLGVTKVHRKPFKILITSQTSINWRKVFFGFGLWLGMTFVAEFAFYLWYPDNYIWQFQPLPFFILLIIVVLLLPIQTSFEELLFRGYLMQGIGLLTKYRWIPLVLTSIGFGALHFANPEVGEFGLGIMMFYYIGTGVFLGILTLKDDSLELALGVHAATNMYSALMVTFESAALHTPALFKLKEMHIEVMTVVFVLMCLLFTFFVAKKYRW